MGRDQGSDVSERIRQVIREHGHLPVDVATLDDDADLFQAGMTSHASVNLMLGLEAAFDIEFPDAMLKRSVFQSVVRHRARPSPNCRRPPHERRRSIATRPSSPAIRRIADEVAAPNADDVDRNARFPAETVEALAGRAGPLGATSPRSSAAAASPSRPIAAACFELGRRCGASAMVFAMHQIQIAAIVRHVDGRALVRGRTCATSRATSGWSRRSPPRSAPAATSASRSRRSRPATTASPRSRSRRRPCRTAPTRTTC